MGSDNLHHKRKAKRDKDVGRKKASRVPYQKVLIVCEGGKTEPLYFNEIRDLYEINTANIRITGECGSDPISVVNHALALFDAEKEKNAPFDRVYCVFDQDSYHLPPNQYQQALDKIAHQSTKNTFFAITSVPCFEYWLLLHFVYTTAPFSAVGGVSVGAAVVNQLKTHWEAYDKGATGTFLALKEKLDFATTNAIRSLKAATQNQTDNPTTHIHELVSYLRHIKE